MRPLLDVRRAELRARLAALGLDWIEDPANADPRFLRARVRAELEAEPARRLLPEPPSAPTAPFED